MDSDPHVDLARIADVAPRTSAELVSALTELAKVANQWSDVVRGLREPTRRLVGSAAAASVSTAARRAEEAFLELEMTLGDAQAARRSLPLATPKGEDRRPVV
jgi:ABC-type transporter Mla subunit MlaD